MLLNGAKKKISSNDLQNTFDKFQLCNFNRQNEAFSTFRYSSCMAKVGFYKDNLESLDDVL